MLRLPLGLELNATKKLMTDRWGRRPLATGAVFLIALELVHSLAL
jgi:hypothetical protein